MKINRRILWSAAAPAAFALFAWPACVYAAQDNSPGILDSSASVCPQSDTDNGQSDPSAQQPEPGEEISDNLPAADFAAGDDSQTDSDASQTQAAQPATPTQTTDSDSAFTEPMPDSDGKTEETDETDQISASASSQTDLSADSQTGTQSADQPDESRKADTADTLLQESEPSQTQNTLPAQESQDSLPVFDAGNTISAQTAKEDYKAIVDNLSGALLLEDVDLSNLTIVTGNNVYIHGSVWLDSLCTDNAGIFGLDKDAQTDILHLNMYSALGDNSRVEDVTLDMSQPYEGEKFCFTGSVEVKNSRIVESNATGDYGCGLFAQTGAVSFEAADSELEFCWNSCCGINLTWGNPETSFRFERCRVAINDNGGNGVSSYYNEDGTRNDTPQFVFVDTNVNADRNGWTLASKTGTGYSGFSYTTIALVNTDGKTYTFSASSNKNNGVGGYLSKMSSLSADGYTIITRANQKGTGIKQNASGSHPLIQNSTIISTGNHVDLSIANGVHPVYRKCDITALSLDYGDEDEMEYDVALEFVDQDGQIVKAISLPVEYDKTNLRLGDIESLIPDGYEASFDFMYKLQKNHHFPSVITVALTKLEEMSPLMMMSQSTGMKAEETALVTMDWQQPALPFASSHPESEAAGTAAWTGRQWWTFLLLASGGALCLLSADDKTGKTQRNSK